VKRSAWLGIAAATLVAALAMWFGLFAMGSSRAVGLTVISVGIIFAMYVMAAFNGVEDAATVAFNSSLYSMVAASTLVIMFTISNSPSYAVAAPVVALGVGGVVGIPPVGNRYRMLSRAAAVILAAIIAVAVYWVDHTVYAIVAPLLPLPAVGIADRIFDRGIAIVAE
jgi:hypothetical protein